MEATEITPEAPPIPDHLHSRAALSMMLRRELTDQITYHLRTGNPIADFRTRISELTLSGWPVMRAFHWTHDTNGRPYRCKHYWLCPATMERIYAANPDFQRQCQALREVLE